MGHDYSAMTGCHHASELLRQSQETTMDELNRPYPGKVCANGCVIVGPYGRAPYWIVSSLSGTIMQRTWPADFQGDGWHEDPDSEAGKLRAQVERQRQRAHDWQRASTEARAVLFDALGRKDEGTNAAVSLPVVAGWLRARVAEVEQERDAFRTRQLRLRMEGTRLRCRVAELERTLADHGPEGRNVTNAQHAEMTTARNDALMHVEEVVAERDGERRAGNLHRKINKAVADALGQKFGQTWHDLGDKVATVLQERDQARAELARHIDLGRG